MSDFSNASDVIDIRDVFERIEELEELKQEYIENESVTNDENPSWGEIADANNEAEKDWNETPDGIELKVLLDFVSEFEGYGGDEQWRGSWYPLILIRDDYWEDYAEEECRDLGYISKDFLNWIKIDWKETAENMKVDYTSGDYDGVTYWGR